MKFRKLKQALAQTSSDNNNTDNGRADNNSIRKHITFYGRVQGVGFRYTMRYTASPLGLTGWVKNNWDGSVEAEVQGQEANIEKMIDQLNKNRYIRIDHMIMDNIPLVRESGFSVR